MAGWISLSVSDVKTRLTGSEVTAVGTAALAVGQTDPTSSIISGVVLEVRGRVRNKMTCGTGETIPDNLKHHALAIIVHRLFTRLPLSQFLTPSRVAEYDIAMEVLREYGPIIPDVPLVPDTTAVDGTYFAAPVVTAPTQRFTRDNQAGL